MNTSIFKAYDIRGKVPDEFSASDARTIGIAFGMFIQKECGKEAEGQRPCIAVGQDNRVHSPELFAAAVEGVRSTGVDVVDIGLASTPFFYFAVSYLGLDGGMNVTASHNPPEYNGLKCVRRNAEPIGVETGLQEIQSLAQDLTMNDGKHTTGNAVRGTLTKKDVLSDYIKKNLEFIPVSDLSHLRIAIDTGNGVSVLMIQEFLDAVPLQAIPLYFELDGTFPNHMPNPLQEKNIAALKKTVVERECHCGIALDADGDRSVFINEKGHTIPSDLLTGLIATALLKDHAGEKIVYDATSSWSTREAIQESGGEGVISRVGHSFIKAVMKEKNVLFAGERSGHFYFRFAEYGYFEAPLLVIQTVLNLLVQTQKPLSELIAPYERYASTGEINFEVADKEGALVALKKAYADARTVSHLDGITIEYDDWWANIRPSNTESLLRLNLEARNAGLRDNKLREITAIINMD